MPTVEPSRDTLRYRARDLLWPRELVITDASIAIVSLPDRATVVPWAQVASVSVFDDDVRMVVGRDGSTVVVDPVCWPHAAYALTLLHAATPPGVVGRAAGRGARYDVDRSPLAGLQPARAGLDLARRMPAGVTVQGYVLRVTAVVLGGTVTVAVMHALMR